MATLSENAVSTWRTAGNGACLRLKHDYNFEMESDTNN